MTTAEKLQKIDEGVEETIALNAELEQTLYGTDTDKTLSENVEQTANDFQAIKDKIVEHGVEVADGTKTAEYASKVDDVFEAGKKAEYDAFWDKLQNYGNRVDYRYAFAGNSWNDDNAKPKYDISDKTLTNAYMMFASTNIVDVAKIFPKIKTKVGQYLFYSNTVTKHIGEVIVEDYAHGVFSSASEVETVDKFVVENPSASFVECFNVCSKLKNIVIEANIGASINFQWSTLLSHDSIVSVVTHLSTTATGRTATFSKTAVNNAFETSEGAGDGSTSAEWLALIGTKTNWTISLV